MNPPTIGFTLREYENLLMKTSENYRCVGFEILDDQCCDELPERIAIIRHDIDMSPERALEMARIEAKHDIRATYTVLLTGEFYSPFERHTRSILHEIASLGHDIGLHFNPAWHEINSAAELEIAIFSESTILNQILASNRSPSTGTVKMFSFHDTTPFTMACRRRFYAGLRNAYAGVLQDQMSYISDSNGYWIFRGWGELLEESPKRVQVLAHSEWWTENATEPGEKVCRHLECRSQRVWNAYSSTLAANGRNNKMGLDDVVHILPMLMPRADGDDLLRLWLAGRREQAFIQLFRHFERQANGILKRHLKEGLMVSSQRVNALLSDYKLRLDPIVGLSVLANQPVFELLGYSGAQYADLVKTRDDLIHRHLTHSKVRLRRKFDRLSRLMANLTAWSKRNPVGSRESGRLGGVATNVAALTDWLALNAQALGVEQQEIGSFVGRHSRLFPQEARHVAPSRS